MIDAHHHLWQLARADYGWIGHGADPALIPIERDYLVEDYRRVAEANGVSGSITVQAAQTVAETRWLLQQARNSGGFVRGVVGWVDMGGGKAKENFCDLPQGPLLRGNFPLFQGLPGTQRVLPAKNGSALRAVIGLHFLFY